MATTETTNIEIETLATEGAELAKIITKRDKRDRGEFKRDIEDGGLIVRLGKLMIHLDAIKDGERISSATLKAVGIQAIPTPIRAACKWFVENETDCREFIQASKKGFTNVIALQNAMAKAAKAAAKEEAAETETEAPTEQEASEPVNVESVFMLDATGIAVAIAELAKRDGKAVADVMDEIILVLASDGLAVLGTGVALQRDAA